MGKTNGAEAPVNVLDLATGDNGPRRRVSIDGKVFDVVPAASISLVTMRRARKAAARVSAILSADEDTVSPEMEREFAEASLAVLSIILPDAPATLLKKLPDVERMRLLAFFTETTLGSLPRPTSTPKQRSRRASSASTGDARATG